jgi:hypothetical protein
MLKALTERVGALNVGNDSTLIMWRQSLKKADRVLTTGGL